MSAQVVIAKRKVLLGVEHFKKRRRWIAAEVRSDLVDFVEHDERVVGPRLLDRLNDAAGHRADVSAAMAANLGFVVQPAKTQALKLAVERASYRAAKACLADTRRADKTKDRTLDLVF